MGGNTYPVLDDILSTGTNYVACNVETDQAAFVERVSRTHPHVKIRVNLDPGVVACHDPAADLSGDRPRAGDRRPADQLRDGHRRPAAGNPAGEYPPDSRIPFQTRN